MLQQQTLSSRNVDEDQQRPFPLTVNLLMPVHGISKITSLLTYFKACHQLQASQNWHKGHRVPTLRSYWMDEAVGKFLTL